LPQTIGNLFGAARHFETDGTPRDWDNLSEHVAKTPHLAARGTYDPTYNYPREETLL
jgi:hypothetical protein